MSPGTLEAAAALAVVALGPWAARLCMRHSGCRLAHGWEKWVDVETRRLGRRLETDPAQLVDVGVLLLQRRVCRRCGLVQLRSEEAGL